MQVSRLSISFSRNYHRNRVAQLLTTRHLASSSKNTLDSHSHPHSAHESPVVVFDAPSQPSERLLRRSARSPHPLSDYQGRRRLVPRSPTQAGSSASNYATSPGSSGTSPSSSGATPLNTVSYPQKVEPRVFDSPSRPREYYARPQRKRDLPELGSSLTIIAILSVMGLTTWGGFILYATNMERASSSVVRQLSFNLRLMGAVKEALGDNVRLEGRWWLGGEPWIDGAINLLQGKVDVSFRVEGSKGGGTVYFTSVREEKGQHFTILRSKLICDNGDILQLPRYTASTA